MRRTLVLCFLVGCAADNGNGGMIILNNSAAPADMCSFTADPNEPFITQGTLWLNGGAPYVLTPLIQSKITADMGQELQRTIEFRGAKIDLDVGTADNQIRIDGAGTTFSDAEQATMHDNGVTHFKSLFSGSLPPNNGFANVAFEIVEPELLTNILQKVADPSSDVRATVIVSIVPYGDIGGDEVDGDTFVYPVTVCNNCVANQLLSPDGVTPLPCPVPMSAATGLRAGNPCNLFQDGIVDCCTAGNGALVCPATVAPTM